MAFIAGAGNPTGGSNPSGTGTSVSYLRYEKKTLAYAYSGTITVSDATEPATALRFTTGNEAIDAKVMVQWLQAAADADDAYISIELNGEQIGGSYIAADFGGTNVVGPENWIPIIIPPFSTLHVFFTMISGGGSVDLGVTLTGEAYA